MLCESLFRVKVYLQCNDFIEKEGQSPAEEINGGFREWVVYEVRLGGMHQNLQADAGRREPSGAHCHESLSWEGCVPCGVVGIQCGRREARVGQEGQVEVDTSDVEEPSLLSVQEPGLQLIGSGDL